MILGIDPGLANTGYAVLADSKSPETRYKLVECGMIEVGRGQERLRDIFDGVNKIIEKYEIAEMAVESMFFAKNAKSALKVAEAIGVVKVCGMKKGVEVKEYTPLQVKLALVGYGRADKTQVEEMVRQELGLTKLITPSHVADAVAVALTHGFTMKYE